MLKAHDKARILLIQIKSSYHSFSDLTKMIWKKMFWILYTLIMALLAMICKAVRRTMSDFGLDLMNFRGQEYNDPKGKPERNNGLSEILKGIIKAAYTDNHSLRLNFAVCSLTKISSSQNVVDVKKAVLFLRSF